MIGARALLILAVAATAASTAQGAARDYPERPVRLIVAVPPGGAADFTARIVGQKLSEAFGQNVVIENRAGAGGTIAAEMAARATPDGYTLLWSSVTTHGAGPMLYARLPYDAIRDFSHVGLAVSLPMIVVVHNSVPARSVKELVELAKAKPNTLNFASSSSGSLPHLVGELFKARTGAPITHVPYKGSGPAVVDLAAGNVQVMFDAVPALIGQIKAGRLRVIGSVAAKRSELFPDAPTMAEFGYPGVEGVIWYGVSGPTGMPHPVVRRLNGELSKLLALPEVKERFGQQGAVPTPMTPEEYTLFIKAEQAKWGPIVKATGARAD
ncbi:MAG TPA: tripartite tricarboxylate transporter substrate binding protein [Burkholderiales bacterium]|nr:tripartite tricarboxylate transporter substrate binding protein [Burkholderiales bacterium]